MLLSFKACFNVFINTENYDDIRNKITQHVVMTENC